MALGSTQPLVKESTRNISGGKGGRCVRPTTSPPSRAVCHEIWEPKAPGTLWATPGLLRDCFTFTFTVDRSRESEIVGMFVNGEGWKQIWGVKYLHKVNRNQYTDFVNKLYINVARCFKCYLEKLLIFSVSSQCRLVLNSIWLFYCYITIIYQWGR
jgi:hypothetical protein